MESDLAEVRQQAEDAEREQDSGKCIQVADTAASTVARRTLAQVLIHRRGDEHAGQIDDAFNRICLLSIVPGTESP